MARSFTIEDELGEALVHLIRIAEAGMEAREREMEASRDFRSARSIGSTRSGVR
jgi:hypothetical protein